MTPHRGPAKILRVITRLNVGGPTRHVTLLTERLNDDGLASVLVAGVLGRGEGDMAWLPAARGVAVRSLPALGNDRGLIHDLAAVVALYRLMRSERPAIVHLHLLKARLLGGIAARLAGVPVVVETLHGHLLTGYYGPVKTRVLLALERAIGRWLADRIIVLSESQRREVLRWRIGPAERVEVVPLGLELQRLLVRPRGGTLRRQIGVPGEGLLVGGVGRLVPVKGWDVLLRALRLIWQEIGVGVVAVIIGDGPLRGVLEAEAERLEIPHLVRFLGWRTDVEDLYGEMDVFALPSFNEGTPVALIEAMAAGTAVVATRVGGVPDVVEDGRSGLLVPAGDAAALADAILRLWRDPELRERLGEEGRSRVRPQFGLDTLVERLRALYDASLSEGSPRRGAPVAHHSIQHR